MPKYKITKKFKGYPFAHRQPTHDGHCKLIHGHNWDFEICLSSHALDSNGFVYDFGQFKDFRKWLDEMFDHTLLINEDDSRLVSFKLLQEAGLADLKVVESCSCEGLAKFVFEYLKEYLKDHVAEVDYVRVFEDETNTAIYYEG